MAWLGLSIDRRKIDLFDWKVERQSICSKIVLRKNSCIL